jgi:hypothetical protein
MQVDQLLTPHGRGYEQDMTHLSQLFPVLTEPLFFFLDLHSNADIETSEATEKIPCPIISILVVAADATELLLDLRYQQRVCTRPAPARRSMMLYSVLSHSSLLLDQEGSGMMAHRQSGSHEQRGMTTKGAISRLLHARRRLQPTRAGSCVCVCDIEELLVLSAN